MLHDLCEMYLLGGVGVVVFSNRHSGQVTWEYHKYCSLQLIEKDMFTHGSLFDIGSLEQTASLIIALHGGISDVRMSMQYNNALYLVIILNYYSINFCLITININYQ